MKFDVKVHTAHTHTHAKRRKKSLTNHPQIAPMSAQNSPMTSFVWISQSSAIKILFDCIARSPSPVIQSSTPFFSLYNAIITVTVTDCAAGVVACEFGTGVGVKGEGATTWKFNASAWVSVYKRIVLLLFLLLLLLSSH